VLIRRAGNYARDPVCPDRRAELRVGPRL